MKSFLEVRETPRKGRGVYTLKRFKRYEVVEICPVVLLSADESKLCEETILDNYLYQWKNTRDGALVLGYGSIYNHSYNPNAFYKRDFKTQAIIYKALRKINKGEEILINYNGRPTSKKNIEIEGVPTYSEEQRHHF